MSRFCTCARSSGHYGDYHGATPILVCDDCDREVASADGTRLDWVGLGARAAMDKLRECATLAEVRRLGLEVRDVLGSGSTHPAMAELRRAYAARLKALQG